VLVRERQKKKGKSEVITLTSRKGNETTFKRRFRSSDAFLSTSSKCRVCVKSNALRNKAEVFFESSIESVISKGVESRSMLWRRSNRQSTFDQITNLASSFGQHRSTESCSFSLVVQYHRRRWIAEHCGRWRLG
jgi:hypothetical protein